MEKKIKEIRDLLSAGSDTLSDYNKEMVFFSNRSLDSAYTINET